MKAYVTKRDYEMALMSQSACNLSGLVFSFKEVMEKLNNESFDKGYGTDWKNNHPICRLYAEQIKFLTLVRDYGDAHSKCEKGANSQ